MSFQDYIDEMEDKDKLPNYKNLALMGAAIIVVIGLVFVCVGYANTPDSAGLEVIESKDVNSDTATQDKNTDSSDDAQPAQICVYVTGHVLEPKIVYLAEGSRVADAIDACGGMDSEADTSALNLARILQDGEQIEVLSAAEIEAAQLSTTASAAMGSAQSGGSSTSEASASSKVNINTADSAALQTLSGIGESKAKKIIDYREKNGAFKSVDDLANVSGIGEKTVENLREYICV